MNVTTPAATDDPAGGDAMREELLHALLSWMREPWADGPADDHRFNALALRVFAYQFAANAPYRRYCGRRGVTPADISRWRDIPAVATDAFKEAPLTCFPAEQAVAVFETSGTTRGAERRGRHYLRTLDLYHAAALPAISAALLPDGSRPVPVVLFFSPVTLPRSSLAHMFGLVLDRLYPSDAPPTPETGRGDGHSYFLGPEGFDVEGAAARLHRLAAEGRPVLLMGTAFAFVHLLDHLTERGERLRLPPGSRIMDTGGYKGRSREVPKAELYRLYGDLLHVADDHIVNEYGMTEMSSQFYDGALRDRVLGRPARPRGKVAPPWVRTLVVDPETLAPLPPGATGLLRHIDLANLDSVAALQTADLGVADGDGFEITGRAAGAEARGCSLAVEELLDAQRR